MGRTAALPAFSLKFPNTNHQNAFSLHIYPNRDSRRFQSDIINNFHRNILERYDTKQSYLQLIAVNLLCFHRYRSAEIYHQPTICDRLLSGRRCFHRFLIQNAFGGYLEIKCFLHT